MTGKGSTTLKPSTSTDLTLCQTAIPADDQPNEGHAAKDHLEPFVYESSIANHFKFGLNSAIKFLLVGPSRTPSPVWWYLDQHGNEVGPVSATKMLQLWDDWMINVSNYACGVRCPPDTSNSGKLVYIKPPRSFFRMFRQLVTYVRLGGCYQPITMDDIAAKHVQPGWSDPYAYAQTRLGWQPPAEPSPKAQQTNTRGSNKHKPVAQSTPTTEKQHAPAQQTEEQDAQQQILQPQQQAAQQPAPAQQPPVLLPVSLPNPPLQLLQVSSSGVAVLHALPQQAEPLQPPSEEPLASWGIPLQYAPASEPQDASYLIQQTPEGAYLMEHYSQVEVVAGQQPAAIYLAEGAGGQGAAAQEVQQQQVRHSSLVYGLPSTSLNQQLLLPSQAITRMGAIMRPVTKPASEQQAVAHVAHVAHAPAPAAHTTPAVYHTPVAATSHTQAAPPHATSVLLQAPQPSAPAQPVALGPQPVQLLQLQAGACTQLLAPVHSQPAVSRVAAAAAKLQGLQVGSPTSSASSASAKGQQQQQQQQQAQAPSSSLAFSSPEQLAAAPGLKPGRPLVLRAFMPESLAAGEQLSWWYLDDFGHIQGPFAPETMARWYVNDGLRDDLLACGTLGPGVGPRQVQQQWLRTLASIFKQVSQGVPYQAVNQVPVALQQEQAGSSGGEQVAGVYAVGGEVAQPVYVQLDSSGQSVWLPGSLSAAPVQMWKGWQA